MSDADIRKGLRTLEALGPEYAASMLGEDKVKALVQFFIDAKNFVWHDKGNCRYCHPTLWSESERDSAEQSRAILTSEGAVLSSCCKPGSPKSMHGWCSNRNWTESHCSCECHCFVKHYYQHLNQGK